MIQDPIHFVSLALNLEDDVTRLLDASLVGPVNDLFGRPRKTIRGQIVQIGYQLSGPDGERNHATAPVQTLCRRLSEVIETIHAGSLVVDDIQDGSKERRGAPSLHERYGLPIALNAGNYLYFLPMQWISDLGLPEDVELKLYRMYHSTLVRGHLGQALDVGTAIDQIRRDRIPAVCLRSLELKTGALMAFALCTGAAVGGADERRLELLREFGTRFGMALQMFDDLGNLKAPKTSRKRYEDLQLRRPSWIWASVASHCSEPEFDRFLAALESLPDDSALQRWLEETGLADRAERQAREYLRESLRFLRDSLNAHGDFHLALGALSDLAERMAPTHG